MREAYELDTVKTYLNRILIGRESLYDLPPNMPKLKKVTPWDKKDMVMETTDDL